MARSRLSSHNTVKAHFNTQGVSKRASPLPKLCLCVSFRKYCWQWISKHVPAATAEALDAVFSVRSVSYHIVGSGKQIVD
jgi:hypothetical protein